ncbi:MAG: hypothetical protein AAF361_11165, partial [Bacteroidota bacterium]
MDRRNFNKNIGIASGLIWIGGLNSCAPSQKEQDQNLDSDAASALNKVSPELSQRMYDKALEITKSKVRGGDSEVFFKKPFIDAA